MRREPSSSARSGSSGPVVRRARCAATRSMRPATSARGRTAPTSTDEVAAASEAVNAHEAAHGSPAAVMGRLRDGEIDPIGWLVGSSNNAMVVRVRPSGSDVPVVVTSDDRDGDGDGDTATIELGPEELLAVWKPTRGERPLFDFPIGTLTRREVAAYLVSEAMGWGIVPPTLLRDGPGGEGMLQQWIEVDPDADVIAMVNADDPRLRRVAAFDAVVNNTDRKAGHLLPIPGGHLHAVDHGVTFSIEPKLRTVLWAWEGDPFSDDELAGLRRVREALDGALGRELRELGR